MSVLANDGFGSCAAQSQNFAWHDVFALPDAGNAKDGGTFRPESFCLHAP